MGESSSRKLPKRIDGQDADALGLAIAAVAEEGRPVLIDFDHTLFASNSTELFLASARPAFMASLILGLVRGAIPWHIYSTYFLRLRDYATVLVVIALMPWTLAAWRKKGPRLFRNHTMHPLAEALRRVPVERVTIVSFGITPLIRPLLRGSLWESCQVVSMDIPCKPRDLVSGKAALVRKALPCIAADTAVFVTDSEDDRDLLDVAAIPCLIPRQGARVLAESHFYLPWRYTSLGKYNRAWAVEQGLYVDLVLVVLATRVLWTGSAFLIAGMLLLYVSLHAVYEIGYFENDFKAARLEVEPTLTEGAEMFRGFPLERYAWLWSTVLGALGCFSLVIAGETRLQPPSLLVTWAAVLIATRSVFYVYNRQPAARRLLIYPFLQAAKSFGLLAVLPTFALGAALLSAQVTVMWMNYVIYRQGGRRSDLPREEIRLVAFLVFGIGIALADPSALTEAGLIPVAAMVSWAVWRVAHPLLRQRSKKVSPSPPDSVGDHPAIPG